MFEIAKKKIADLLHESYPEQDVRVVVDKVPYGAWIWDEESRRHIHMKAQEITKSLGDAKQVKSWLDSLPEFKTQWKNLMPTAN